MRASLAVVAMGVIALGCSNSNTATGPDPRNCTKGSVSFPQTITSTLNASSCKLFEYWYLEDSTNYASYDVHLDSGGAYLINLARAPGTGNPDWDAVLELVGTNVNTGDEQLLAISDDEGLPDFQTGGSQLYLVAPQSGTFSLRVMNYDFNDTATYALVTRTCANVLPPIRDSLIASAQSISTNDCMLEDPLFTFDSVQVKLFTIFMDPGHEKEITVSSSVMAPGFQVFGPGFGTACDYWFGGCGGGVAYSNDDDVVSGRRVASGLRTAPGFGSSVNLFINSFGGDACSGGVCRQHNWAGQYTLAVGKGISTEGPDFTLTVQDVTNESDVARVVKSLTPNLFDIKLDHLTKKPRHSQASLARKVTRTKF